MEGNLIVGMLLAVKSSFIRSVCIWRSPKEFFIAKWMIVSVSVTGLPVLLLCVVAGGRVGVGVGAGVSVGVGARVGVGAGVGAGAAALA